MININSRQFRKILNESVINPNQKKGPFKVILQISDANYYENRALELIQEGKMSLFITPNDNQTYHECMRKAITLLTLARLKNVNNNEDNSDKSKR